VTIRRASVLFALLLTTSSLCPRSIFALALQDSDEAWEIETELGGAFFFGNRSQTTISTAFEATRADSASEVEIAAGFTYGESTDDDGVEIVTKRSWKLGAEYDGRPLASWSPFLSGEIESSFERRIDLRYTVGAGARYQVVRSERGRLGLTLSLLAEQTFPAETDEDRFDDELLARWSLAARAQRSWDDGRLTFSTENDYRPELDRVNEAQPCWNLVGASKSSLAFRVTEIVSLKLTLVDTYDSRSVERGADTNNDGRFLISVLAQF